MFSYSMYWPIFRCVCKIAKNDYYLRCLSVRLHRTTGLSLDGFSYNLIFDYFSTICEENSSFIKIWQEYGLLYVKTKVHIWLYLVNFFLEREMFWTKVVEKIKTDILYSILFFRKSCHLWDNVEKYSTARQTTNNNTVHAHFTADT
jgi:hypothetical protein